MVLTSSGKHSCSLACSIRVHLCSIRVLFVFARVLDQVVLRSNTLKRALGEGIFLVEFKYCLQHTAQ